LTFRRKGEIPPGPEKRLARTLAPQHAEEGGKGGGGGNVCGIRLAVAARALALDGKREGGEQSRPIVHPSPFVQRCLAIPHSPNYPGGEKKKGKNPVSKLDDFWILD